MSELYAIRVRKHPDHKHDTLFRLYDADGDLARSVYVPDEIADRFEQCFRKVDAGTILSCPFCGSTEVEIARTNPNACWVECAGCGAKADSAPTREEAIANWNKTVPRVSATVIDDGDADYWNTVAWIEARRDGQE